jgi:hypothetical protein
VREMKRPLWIPRRWWEDNIKVCYEERREDFIGIMWLRIGPGKGCCEHGDEASGSINCREFLD